MLRIIVITDTPFLRSEADTVSMLLDEGVERVHLRKPGSDESDMRRLIESIDPRLYPRLTLQDHLPLAAEYDIGGVHLNARNKSVPDSFGGLVSRSCHTFDELSRCTGEDYMFLSPLFDSISKRGYRAAFTADSLRRAAARGIISRRVVALGGIEPRHLPQLCDLGFGGAAFLGYIWQTPSQQELRQRIRKIVNYTESCFNS